MNIQEQLEKIVGGFKQRHPSVFWDDAIHCNCFGEDKEEGIPSLPDDIIATLHTSALKLLKTAYEEERERLKKSLENDDAEKPEGEDLEYDYKLCRLVGRNQAKEHTITHLNTKIAEVDRLLDNK